MSSLEVIIPLLLILAKSQNVLFSIGGVEKYNSEMVNDTRLSPVSHTVFKHDVRALDKEQLLGIVLNTLIGTILRSLNTWSQLSA